MDWFQLFEMDRDYRLRGWVEMDGDYLLRDRVEWNSHEDQVKLLRVNFCAREMSGRGKAKKVVGKL